jgi:hypothetical protein
MMEMPYVRVRRIEIRQMNVASSKAIAHECVKTNDRWRISSARNARGISPRKPKMGWLKIWQEFDIFFGVVYHDPHKSVIMSPIDPIRLADELHDGIVQELSATLLMLETYQRRLKLDPEAAEVELERIKLQLLETVRQVRLVIRQLRS